MLSFTDDCVGAPCCWPSGGLVRGVSLMIVGGPMCLCIDTDLS